MLPLRCNRHRGSALRYASRDDYVARVRKACQDMVAQGYLLVEDVQPVIAEAGARYDHFRFRLPAKVTA